jgi:phosphohistidine phosphatase
MLRIMLLRHAQAERPPGLPDHQRPLTHRGQLEGKFIARYMLAEGLRPDLAIVSTAVRTQETWRHVSTAFDDTVDHVDESELYEVSMQGILQVIRNIKQGPHSVLLVGHNPGLSDVADYLCAPSASHAMAQMHRGYPPGALAVLDFDVDQWTHIAHGGGKLERFVRAETGQGA